MLVGDITDAPIFESNLFRLRFKKDLASPAFYYYYFKSPLGKQLIQKIAKQTAAASITASDLIEQPVPYFDRLDQDKITHILGTLDDKIELNREINTTLESMAQALFKSWFVDFDPVIDNALATGNDIPDALQAKAAKRQALGDKRKPLPDGLQQQFPDRFVFTEEMGWVPDGWAEVEIGSVLERLKVPNRYKKKEVLEHGLVPVYEQGADILLGYHNSEPDFHASPDAPVFVFGDHTCITKLSVSPFSISENVIPLKGNVRNTYWTYYAVAGKQQFEEYRRHWMELVVKSVILPCEVLADEYAKFIKPIVEKQAQISQENALLTRLRDTLLPKLLSGELRIPEAEKQLAEAL